VTRRVECTTQAELDAALKDKTVTEICLVGAGAFSISGSAQVRAYDRAQVTAGKFVAVTRHGTSAEVDGGVLIQIPAIATAADWCDYYGVTVIDGAATLYKGVGADFASPHGTDYTPGTTPSAPDWLATNDCGHGLHFSPRPMMTLAYNPDAKKYVACQVRVDELVLITDGSSTPDKVKGPRVLSCHEVDIDGEPVAAMAGAQ
jgi:hypothetical protein